MVAQIPSSAPGTGIDRVSGVVIDGWTHVEQSIGVIFTTRFGERVMRRWFGSAVPGLLGRNMTKSTILRFWTAVCVAIDLWEPRFRVTKIGITAVDADAARAGRIGFVVEGIYYPRGHLGDTSVAVAKRVPLSAFARLMAAGATFAAAPDYVSSLDMGDPRNDIAAPSLI